MVNKPYTESTNQGNQIESRKNYSKYISDSPLVATEPTSIYKNHLVKMIFVAVRKDMRTFPHAGEMEFRCKKDCTLSSKERTSRFENIKACVTYLN